LDGGIDGLVHLSDISWTIPGEEAVRNYKKGDELEAVVLAIDVERERISLGIKQMDGDIFSGYIATHDKGSVVNGVVKAVDAKGATITLDGDVEGYLKASELSSDRVEDLRLNLKEGDAVKAVIINIDRKNRGINLSVKVLDKAEETAAMHKFTATSDNASSSGTTNLGALLKAKMDTNKSDAQ
jgi:small subunit ribosomal protein S1